MEEKAIADWDWMPLGQLAKAKNPGFNPDALANKVKGGVAGWGTNESQVYAGLGGARTAVERAALAKCYQALFHVSMEEDVADDMGGHEMERAKALMEGKGAEADAATIKEAVEGMGTDEQAIRDALRGKTPEELDEIKAEYLKKYGTPLKADLADDMSGAELDNTLALSDGDVDKADAAELEDAMAGPGTDEAKLKKVYERIREEEEARAKKDGISPAELKQRILDRNARVSAKFGEKYGDLQAKLEDELLDGEKRPNPKMGEVADDGDLKVLDALQSGDPSKIDAAKAYAEHKSVYTSDDEIEKVVRNQRRTAELDVALEMKSERARLDALKASGDIDPKEYEKRSQELDAAAKDKDGIEKRTQAKAGQNMGALKSEYSKATDGRQSFDMLVKNETSGYSNDEITELVASGGKLSDAQEMYYSVAGAGTDEDKIKEVLKGKTPAQIEEIRKEYKRLHPDSNLDDDILGDLSGREDLDVGHTLKYGDPDTFAEQLEAEKDPEKRKKLVEGMKQMLAERRDFEETGMIGSIFALGADPMNSADQLEEAVKRADMYNTALTKNEEDNRGKDPKDIKPDPLLTAAKANFEMTYGGAVEAQEQVRAQIDSYTDAVTQVGAAIAGIAVTVATLGAAGPVVAAVYGAAAAAAATMALKAHPQGRRVLVGGGRGRPRGGDGRRGRVGRHGGTRQGRDAGPARRPSRPRSPRRSPKEGAEKVTESVVKVWVKEAMEEAIENAIQAMPSAFVGAMLDDNTWKSGDPWGTIWSATGQAGAMGAGMAVGIKGAKDIGGAAIGKIKGAKAEPKAGAKVEPKVEPHEASPHGGSTAEPPPAHVDTPDPKPLELPPAADPAHATASAEKGELPNEAHGKDLTKGGKLPESATPDPKPEPHAPEKLPEKEPGWAGDAHRRERHAEGRHGERRPARPDRRGGDHRVPRGLRRAAARDAREGPRGEQGVLREVARVRPEPRGRPPAQHRDRRVRGRPGQHRRRGPRQGEPALGRGPALARAARQGQLGLRGPQPSDRGQHEGDPGACAVAVGRRRGRRLQRPREGVRAHRPAGQGGDPLRRREGSRDAHLRLRPEGARSRTSWSGRARTAPRSATSTPRSTSTTRRTRRSSGASPAGRSPTTSRAPASRSTTRRPRSSRASSRRRASGAARSDPSAVKAAGRRREARRGGQARAREEGAVRARTTSASR